MYVRLSEQEFVGLKDLIETLINITYDKDLRTIPINIILTSCQGKHAHDSIEKLEKKLPIGSKIITLSNYYSSTSAMDSECSEHKLNKLIEISNSREFKFTDLLKLYSFTQTCSQNTPTIGTQTKSGYKFIDLNQIANIPISMYSKNSEFLEEILDTDILSRNNMEELICDIGNNSIPTDGLKYYILNVDKDLTDSNFLTTEKLELISSYFFKNDTSFNEASSNVRELKKSRLDYQSLKSKLEQLVKILENESTEHCNVMLNLFYEDASSYEVMMYEYVNNKDSFNKYITQFGEIQIGLDNRERVTREIDSKKEYIEELSKRLSSIENSIDHLNEDKLITTHFLPEGVSHPHTKYGYLLIKATDMLTRFEDFEKLFAIVELGMILKEIALIVEKYTEYGVADFIANIDQHLFSCYDKSGLINQEKLNDINTVMGLILERHLDINTEFSTQLNFLFENYVTFFEKAKFIATHQTLDDFVFHNEENNSSDEGFLFKNFTINDNSDFI